MSVDSPLYLVGEWHETDWDLAEGWPVRCHEYRMNSFSTDHIYVRGRVVFDGKYWRWRWDDLYGNRRYGGVAPTLIAAKRKIENIADRRRDLLTRGIRRLRVA
jgi:hypothetical protein